jgi:hypothetical protein
MNLLRNLPFILCIAAISGCTSTSSENVTTQGIAADIDIFADGSGRTFVDVSLEVGSGGIGGTSLQLSPGDTLTVRANGIQKTMSEDSSIFGAFSYFATFDFDDANTLFTVSLNRTNGTNAPNSNVTLPDGFNVTSPSISDVFGVGDTIPIVWSPAGTAIVPSLFVTLTCTLTSGLTSIDVQPISLGTDSGIANLPVASVIPIGTLDTSRLCNGTIELSRWRSGSLDPNYGEGGQIDAEQAKVTTFFVNLTR